LDLGLSSPPFFFPSGLSSFETFIPRSTYSAQYPSQSVDVDFPAGNLFPSQPPTLFPVSPLWILPAFPMPKGWLRITDLLLQGSDPFPLPPPPKRHTHPCQTFLLLPNQISPLFCGKNQPLKDGPPFSCGVGLFWSFFPSSPKVPPLMLFFIFCDFPLMSVPQCRNFHEWFSRFPVFFFCTKFFPPYIGLSPPR